MTNLQKRILTSLIILPLSFFFIIKGGHLLFFFLVTVFCLANYELFSCFKKVYTILIINLILILSLFSIYYLSNQNLASFLLLLWVIILTVFSDIGGYIFGKFFKGPKLSKLSPNKTISGALGSLILSCVTIFFTLYYLTKNFDLLILLIGCLISISCQVGDLFFSFLKRKSNLKDTSNFLPGHGGLLDRVDGILFGLPVGFFTLIMIY